MGKGRRAFPSPFKTKLNIMKIQFTKGPDTGKIVEKEDKWAMIAIEHNVAKEYKEPAERDTKEEKIVRETKARKPRAKKKIADEDAD